MKRILIPLDGTLVAEQALPTAVALARRHQSALELMLVNDAKPGGGLEGWPWAISSARSHCEYITSRARRVSDAAGSNVEHTVGEGRAADEICRRASERKVDLIVMVTRGYTGLTRVLGGGVADAVVRKSRIPVLLLHAVPTGRRVRRTPLHIERIVIAVDGSAESFAALDAACALADRGVTELHLAEVVAPVSVSPFSVVRRIARMDRAATQRVVDRAAERLGRLSERVAERTGCDVYPHVLVNEDPARGIVRLAHGFNASIIAMGTHGRGASRLLMGSVAEQVLADARYPMLVVHPGAGSSSTDQRLWEEPCVQHQHP